MIVSATVCLFTDPSLSSFVNISIVAAATGSPIYAVAVQAAALTFQYESFNALTRTFYTFNPISGEVNFPIAHTAIALTLGSSSSLLIIRHNASMQACPSGIPMVPICAAITSLTCADSSLSSI